MTFSWRLVDVVSRLLEPDEREAVCGDLTESGASGGQAFVDVLGLVARRQASQWAHVAPWLACIGIAVPIGALLSHVSRFWADTWAIDAFVWLNAWTWSFLVENPGYRDGLISTGTRDLLHGVALIGWAWATGFALATLSRRTLWFTATLFALIVWIATRGTTTTARANVFNAEVFAMPLYSVGFPLLSQILVLLSALVGMRRGLRPRAISWRATMIVVATMVILTAWSGRALHAAMVLGREPLRNAAPDFVLHDATGAPIKLSDYKGKVVLLDFWATWCGGCKTEIPWYMEFQTKYHDQGLVSIGVAMDDEGWKTVKPYLAEHPINYPIVVADPDITKSYATQNLPVTLLIDREGRIAKTMVGLVVKDEWEQTIQRLLREP